MEFLSLVISPMTLTMPGDLVKCATTESAKSISFFRSQSEKQPYLDRRVYVVRVKKHGIDLIKQRLISSIVVKHQAGNEATTA